jgi:hypothetical protein
MNPWIGRKTQVHLYHCHWTQIDIEEEGEHLTVTGYFARLSMLTHHLWCIAASDLMPPLNYLN